jgi:hypothetical protein
MNAKKVVLFLSLSLAALVWLYSCAPLITLPPAKPRIDPFSRVYPVPLKDFHPALNQALQNYAKEKPGNSFQVARLGNDMVVFRGYYQKDPQAGRLPVVITTKPDGLQRTRCEINPQASQSGVPEAAAGELFQIIEAATGYTPVQ